MFPLIKLNVKKILLIIFISRALFLTVYIKFFAVNLVPITKDNFFDVGTDGYVQAAYNLMYKHSYEYLPGWKVHSRPPLHPIILSITMLSPKYWHILWVTITLILFLIATIFYVKTLTALNQKKLLSNNAANIAIYLWILHPYLFLSLRTTTFIPEAVTLITIFLYLLLRTINVNNTKNFLLLGIITALLMLTHPTFMLIPFIITLTLTPNPKKVIIYFLVITIIISPWVYRNYKTFNKIFIYTGAGSQYWKGEEAAFGKDDIEIKTLSKAKGKHTPFLYFYAPTPDDDNILLKLAIKDAINNPVKTIKRILIGLYMFWAPYETGPLKSIILVFLNFPIVIFTYYHWIKKLLKKVSVNKFINILMIIITTFSLGFAFFCSNASYFIMFLPLLFLCFTYFLQDTNVIRYISKYIRILNKTFGIIRE